MKQGRQNRKANNVATALKGVEFIAQHIKKADKDNEVSQIGPGISRVTDCAAKFPPPLPEIEMFLLTESWKSFIKIVFSQS